MQLPLQSDGSEQTYIGRNRNGLRAKSVDTFVFEDFSSKLDCQLVGEKKKGQTLTKLIMLLSVYKMWTTNGKDKDCTRDSYTDLLLRYEARVLILLQLVPTSERHFWILVGILCFPCFTPSCRLIRLHTVLSRMDQITAAEPRGLALPSPCQMR